MRGKVQLPDIRVSDILSEDYPEHGPLTDEQIIATCPVCGEIPLSDSILSKINEIVYIHSQCLSVLVVIGFAEPEYKRASNKGIAIGKFIIGNAVELSFHDIRIPASPDVLEKRLPNPGDRR